MAYKLSRQADDDLFQIYLNGIRDFGLAQADDYGAGLKSTFEFLADFPWAARERIDIAPSVGAYAYKAHLITYDIVGDDIVMIRIFHDKQDWERLLP